MYEYSITFLFEGSELELQNVLDVQLADISRYHGAMDR